MHIVTMRIFGHVFSETVSASDPALGAAYTACRAAPSVYYPPGAPQPPFGVGFLNDASIHCIGDRRLCYLGVVLDSEAPHEETFSTYEAALADVVSAAPPAMTQAFSRFPAAFHDFHQTRACTNTKIFMQTDRAECGQLALLP